MFQEEVKIIPCVMSLANGDSPNVRHVILYISHYYLFNPHHNLVRVILFHMLPGYR